MRLTGVLLLIAALCAACGADRPPDGAGLAVSRDTLDGVERITTAGEVETWTLHERLRLGSAGGSDEPESDEFAFVSSVALGPDGRVYVADLRRSRISVFDTLGVLQRVMGREGQGPGEFVDLFSIAWLDDRLLALDVGNARVGVFSSEGAWVDQRPASGSLTASPATTRLYPVGPAEVYQWGYETRDGIAEPVWWPHGPAGRGAAVSRPAPTADASFPDKVVCTMGRGFSWFDHPFAEQALVHPTRGGGTLVASTDTYRIVELDAAGDTLRVLVRDVPRPALSDEEWQPVRDRFAAWLEDKDPSRCRPEDLPRPIHKPAIRSLLVDTTGRTWVERSLPVGTVWEVFDADGVLVGAVPGLEHDRQWTVPWLSRTTAVWVSRDALDVPYVHVARIEAPGGPG